MIIKVCGMREIGNIREVAALGVDWIGLIFYPQSPRYVGGATAGRGIDGLDAETGFKRVGVFVNDTTQRIVALAATCHLDIIQLHGHESPEQTSRLRAELSSRVHPGIALMKAVSVKAPADIERSRDYEECADYLLFDTRCDCMGGSGRQFDWTVLDRYTSRLPFLLSGGIGPEDTERIRALKHPMLAGIDLNSRFERSTGLKDAEALKKFISILRHSPAPVL